MDAPFHCHPGTITTVRVDHLGRPQPLSPAERAALRQGLEPTA